MIHETNVEYNFGGGTITLLIMYDEDEENPDNNYIIKVATEDSEVDLYDFLLFKCPIVLNELLELAEQKMNSKDARIEELLDDRKNREEL